MSKLEAKKKALAEARASVVAKRVLPSPVSKFEQEMHKRAQRAHHLVGTTPAPDTFRRKQSLATADFVRDAKMAEVLRICAMPIVLGMNDEELEQFSYDHILGPAYEARFRLLPTQANSLKAYKEVGGLLAPVGVGLGKTLLSLMIAQHAYEHENEKVVLLLVPPQVVPQLVADIRWARVRVRLTVPIHNFYRQGSQRRRSMANARWPGLYIMPYSLLSARDASELLDALRPGLVVADEAHNISRKNAARTKRFLHYINKTNPDCRLAAMSGTITDKTILDYYHLAKIALRHCNPLPNEQNQANDWAMMLDSIAPTNQQAGPLLPLCQWAAEHFPDASISETREGFRRAYKLRLNSSPGVVASADQDIKTSLILQNERVPVPDTEAGQQLQELIDQVVNEWLTPNGDEIDHAIHQWKWLNELTVGFYNQLIWPTPERLASQRGVSLGEAESLLARAKHHHEAQQDYAKLLRDFLQTRSKPGLDTPFLVGGDMAQHQAKNVTSELYKAWRVMKDREFEGMPERESHAVRICDYKVRRVAQWAVDKKCGCILWTYHQEIGRWLFEILSGMTGNVLHCPAGADEQIIDTANRDKIIVASMSAHGTGKNLQHFSEQYFVQWPRSAKLAEQVIGRTHRTGQKADELVVMSNCTSTFDALNRAACINDALYIHQTTGNNQKLIYGTYNPIPQIFPPEVLREKGLDAKVLSADQRRMIEEKFGGPSCDS